MVDEEVQKSRETLLKKIASKTGLSPEDQQFLSRLPQNEARLLRTIALSNRESNFTFHPDYPLQEQSKVLIEATPVGICITNSRGLFEYVNPAYCKFYGYEAPELLGKSFLTVVPKEYHEELDGLHQEFLSGRKELRGEWTVVHRDGRTLDILADAVKIYGNDGEPRKVTIIQDLTDRKTFERKLQEEILVRSNLEKLRDKVEQMIRHDLRNPLSGILGSCQYLLMIKDELSAEVLEVVQIMYLSAQKLNSLLDTTVDLVRLEQGSYTLDRSTTNLTPLLFHAVQELDFFAEAKNVKVLLFNGKTPLETQHNFSAKVHTTLFQTMISNVLRNAIEASNEDQEVRFSINPEVKKGKQGYTLTMINSGVIPESIQPGFFRRTVDSTKVNGTGLGSYIVGLIVEAHTGLVTFDSSTERGTTVEIWLPRGE